MLAVTLRFYAELNDFVAAGKRYRDGEYAVAGGRTVKDLVESEGVPHTEIDLIVVNGESVDFEYRLRGGDRVAVYPVFESLDIAAISRLRAEPLRVTRFTVDANLGQLARYLRLCGFDSLYVRDAGDGELAALAARETRVLLTRDVGVLKRSAVTHGYFVRATDPRAQLVEVVRRFDLAGDFRPFTRCMNCNGELTVVPKEEIADELDANTRRYYNDFVRCPGCLRVYWKGSHYDKLLMIVEDARREGIHEGTQGEGSGA